jgi:hypothetical protein
MPDFFARNDFFEFADQVFLRTGHLLPLGKGSCRARRC